MRFFSIPKIWTVIFCFAVMLVPFFGEEGGFLEWWWEVYSRFICFYEHAHGMEGGESTTECWNGKFVEREITQKVFYLYDVS